MNKAMGPLVFQLDMDKGAARHTFEVYKESYSVGIVHHQFIPSVITMAGKAVPPRDEVYLVVHVPVTEEGGTEPDRDRMIVWVAEAGVNAIPDNTVYIGAAMYKGRFFCFYVDSGFTSPMMRSN